MARSERFFARHIAAAVVAGLVGLALNRLPVATVTPLLLGRVATLPIAILFGPWLGVQFSGTLHPGETQRWFTYNWPACW